MKERIVRNLTTNANKEFWAAAERAAAEVEAWPAWKKAGINVAALRSEPRTLPDADDTASPTASCE